MQSNRSGSPQSFIFLIDSQKAVFINSYDDVRAVITKYENGDKIDGRVLPGQYKMDNDKIFIFLIKGVQFNGSRVDDALFLVDHVGESVVFYKYHQ